MGRLEERVVKNGTTEIYSIEPSYSAGTGNIGTSTQVASYNGDTYTYDDNGNITSIYTEGSLVSYTYDSQGPLIWEKSDITGYATQWEYDNAGNIVSREVYDYGLFEIGESIDTVNYGYQDPDGWGDLLTSYDGRTITYDEIGNPLSDGEWTYIWEHGRQLSSMTKGNTTWTYTYDANGMRARRTDGESDYVYEYNGSQLVSMSVDGYTHYFTYDAAGTPLAITIGDANYFYVTNLQGDVVGILDEDGEQIATYRYTAWGEVECISDHPVADYNPLTYRGYVYDWETGLYYLQSRYYNPEWGRFINADVYTTTGQGLTGNNMFTYCNNNPINQIDSTGEIAAWLVALICVGVMVVATAVDHHIAKRSSGEFGKTKPHNDGAVSRALYGTGSGFKATNNGVTLLDSELGVYQYSYDDKQGLSGKVSVLSAEASGEVDWSGVPSGGYEAVASVVSGNLEFSIPLGNYSLNVSYSCYLFSAGFGGEADFEDMRFKLTLPSTGIVPSLEFDHDYN